MLPEIACGTACLEYILEVYMRVDVSLKNKKNTT